MSSVLADRVFRRMDTWERLLCVRFNRVCRRRALQRGFALISRSGDGIFWYTLILLLPLLYGSDALWVSLQMSFAGVVGLLLYKALKHNLVRERPYISWDELALGTAPLDRYSFPSGHTLHAVAFTTVAVSHYPDLAWLLVPYALLIAASRVVLGLHYPTDVLAGAAIGGVVAWAALGI